MLPECRHGSGRLILVIAIDRRIDALTKYGEPWVQTTTELPQTPMPTIGNSAVNT